MDTNFLNEELEDIVVVKRNGKKVSFDGSKIALAIKKGFDSVLIVDEDENTAKKYNVTDIQKIYQAVLKKIENDADSKGRKFKIEEIQDYISAEKRNDKRQI